MSAVALEEPRPIEPSLALAPTLPENLPPPANSNFWLHSGNTLYMANGLQPIGSEVIKSSGGAKEATVLAKLKYKQLDGEPRELWITQESTDPQASDSGTPPIVIHRIEQSDGDNHSRGSRVIVAGEPFRLQDKNIGLSYLPSDKHHRGWASIRSYGPVGFDITVSKADHPLLRTMYEQRDTKRRLKKAKRLGALALMLLAFKATTTPGGIYDKVMDPHENAGQYVYQQFGSWQQDVASIPKNGKMVDGVHETRQQLIEGDRSDYSNYYHAVDRVAGVMSALDSHNYAKIRRDAAEFKKFEDIFLLNSWSAEQVSGFKEQLAAAKTTSEGLAVLNKFLGKYGSQALTGDQLSQEHINGQDFLNKLKVSGEQLIDVVASLPEPVVRRAIGIGAGNKLTKDGPGVVFAFGEKQPTSVMRGKEEAYEDTSPDGLGSRITLLSTGRFDYSLGSIGLFNLKHVIRHEMSHALWGDDLDPASGIGSGLTYQGQIHGNSGSILSRTENFGSELLGSSNYVSDYATTNPEEETAEAGAQILAGQITNPDHVLGYESRANRTKLAALIDLERGLPNITAYLIATLNPALIGEQPKH